MIGATLTPTGIPASVSSRMVRSRRAGVAARGSSVRAMPASSVVIVTAPTASRLAAMGASKSISRSISDDFVISATGWSVSCNTSNRLRVMRCSRSMGW
ncbi:hypothetical protein D3C85_1229600 [compost metagenome]